MILSGENVLNYEGLYYFLSMLSSNMGSLQYYEDETDAWTAHPHLKEFSEKLSTAVYDYEYDLEQNYENYYFDMGVEKSEAYISWFENFSNYMWSLGFGVSEAYFDNEGSHSVYQASAPWEEDFYKELKNTGDYWWFLVCTIQKFSSPCDEDFVPNSWEISDKIEETYKNSKNGFSFDWFLPLKSFLVSRKMMDEYKKYNLKSIKEASDEIDFSNLEEADLTDIPEFEVEDSYVEKDGKYYSPIDVFMAITAAGGMAQALEKQDLEGKITTVNSLQKKKKKIRIKRK